MEEKDITEAAIKNISFGKERVNLGYDDISVDVVKTGNVNIDGKNSSNVPTAVKIKAKKSNKDV